MTNTQVQGVELSQLPDNEPGQKAVAGNQYELVKDVKVKVQAYLGGTQISIGELFDLKENTVLKLDMPTSAPIDLVLDNNIVARGNLVVVEDNFGIQISEVVGIDRD